MNAQADLNLSWKYVRGVRVLTVRSFDFLSLSAPNFRRHLSSAFFILTNYRLERRLYVKLIDRMSNSVDPDETAQSHLDLCCLQKPIIIVCGSERVK